MGFNTENRTIFDIFQRQSRYVIPRYQREYVWKQRNWDELLNDITFTLGFKNEKNEWTHFLGTIVLSSNVNLKDSLKIKGIKDYEIIDGQQRITTLFLLLTAICSVLYRNKINEEALQRAKYVETTFINSITPKNEYIPILFNSEYELYILELLQNMKEDYISSISSDNPYKGAYEYFYNYFLHKKFTDIDLFLEKLYDINIVEIVSEQEEEIYNIFEVLNARGQQLKQIELLKNHTMKYIYPKIDDYIDSARKKWIDIYNHAENLPHKDDLLNHFAKCYLKRKAENANDVYRLFKEEIKIDDMSCFLDDLHRFSSLYAQATDKNTLDNNIKYFNLKNNKQIRSLLTSILESYNKKIVDEDVKNKTLKNLRNFFMIFNASRETSNRTDNLIKNAAYAIYNSESELEFKIEISSLFYELNNLISYDQFKNNYSSALKYSNKDQRLKNSKLMKYVLVEYYTFYQTDAFLNDNDITIEHLLGDKGDTENAHIHNLALANELVNSAKLRDKPVNQKIEILDSCSNLVVNKELSSFLNTLGEFDSELRKEKLAEIFFYEIFNFQPSIFGWEKEDLNKYLFNLKKIRETLITKESLLIQKNQLEDVLKSKGKHFEVSIKNNPNYNELKEIYSIVFEDDLFLINS